MSYIHYHHQSDTVKKSHRFPRVVDELMITRQNLANEKIVYRNLKKEKKNPLTLSLVQPEFYSLSYDLWNEKLFSSRIGNA